VRAAITSLQGFDSPSGFPAYNLKLSQRPLARANGILIPTETDDSAVCAGVDTRQTSIQQSPPLEQLSLQQSEGNGLDLSKVPAVPITQVVPVTKGTPTPRGAPAQAFSRTISGCIPAVSGQRTSSISAILRVAGT
jgi:hypothetical protein